MASALLQQSPLPASPPVAVRLEDGVELVLEDQQAYLDGSSLGLTSREFALLRHLVKRAGNTCDRFELRRHGFGDRSGGESRKVDVHVQRVRAKLGAHAYLVQTLRGDGYRFATTAPR
jgi:two-component system, OmpR family, alkaline phosphatase synthesis response regulator PhoP